MHGNMNQKPNNQAPPCVRNAMLSKDKQPFTYTPGGIDLSQIKSDRMAKRLARNAHDQGVPNTSLSLSRKVALSNVNPSTPNANFAIPPPPPNPMDTKRAAKISKCPPSQLVKQHFEPPPIGLRPEIKIPPNPLASLRKVDPPIEKNTFWKEEYIKERSKSPLVKEKGQVKEDGITGTSGTNSNENHLTKNINTFGGRSPGLPDNTDNLYSMDGSMYKTSPFFGNTTENPYPKVIRDKLQHQPQPQNIIATRPFAKNNVSRPHIHHQPADSIIQSSQETSMPQQKRQEKPAEGIQSEKSPYQQRYFQESQKPEKFLPWRVQQNQKFQTPQSHISQNQTDDNISTKQISSEQNIQPLAVGSLYISPWDASQYEADKSHNLHSATSFSNENHFETPLMVPSKVHESERDPLQLHCNQRNQQRQQFVPWRVQQNQNFEEVPRNAFQTHKGNSISSKHLDLNTPATLHTNISAPSRHADRWIPPKSESHNSFGNVTTSSGLSRNQLDWMNVSGTQQENKFFSSVQRPSPRERFIPISIDGDHPNMLCYKNLNHVSTKFAAQSPSEQN